MNFITRIERLRRVVGFLVPKDSLTVAAGELYTAAVAQDCEKVTQAAMYIGKVQARQEEHKDDYGNFISHIINWAVWDFSLDNLNEYIDGYQAAYQFAFKKDMVQIIQTVKDIINEDSAETR